MLRSQAKLKLRSEGKGRADGGKDREREAAQEETGIPTVTGSLWRSLGREGCNLLSIESLVCYVTTNLVGVGE